jgi:hypothetical protein
MLFVFRILCQIYFVCKFLHCCICTVSSRLHTDTASRYIFALDTEMYIPLLPPRAFMASSRVNFTFHLLTEKCGTVICCCGNETVKSTPLGRLMLMQMDIIATDHRYVERTALHRVRVHCLVLVLLAVLNLSAVPPRSPFHSATDHRKRSNGGQVLECDAIALPGYISHWCSWTDWGKQTIYIWAQSGKHASRDNKSLRKAGESGTFGRSITGKADRQRERERNRRLQEPLHFD